jgi:hypothetical protein
MKQLTVHKGRTVVVPVKLPYDVSQDTITSEIRSEPDPTSQLLATWAVTFATDGTDGEIVLTLDDSVTSSVQKTVGYMDIKRVTDGEPVSVFNDPLEVLFKNTITA